MKLSAKKAFEAIDKAKVCDEYKDFARLIIGELTGETKPKPVKHELTKDDFELESSQTVVDLKFKDVDDGHICGVDLKTGQLILYEGLADRTGLDLDNDNRIKTENIWFGIFVQLLVF